MNDSQGNWIPPEEDGNDYDPVPLFFRNVAQRFRELRTAREDERQPIGQWEARRRLAEAEGTDVAPAAQFASREPRR